MRRSRLPPEFTGFPPGDAIPGLFAQANLTVDTSWAQFHYSGRRKGWNPYENVLGPGNVSAIDQDWSFAAGAEILSSPAVANGVVYVGSDDNNVYALDAATGAGLWSYATGSIVISSPAVANGVVYVGSFDGNVYALDAATGAGLWSYATADAVYSSPAVANGVVYVGSADRNLYAFGLVGGLA